jgi:hypothetical protein
MTVEVVRDYDTFGLPAVSVLIGTNNQGRCEPFVFERRGDAERFAYHLEDQGEIDLLLIYHGVTITNEAQAQRLLPEPHLKEVK